MRQKGIIKFCRGPAAAPVDREILRFCFWSSLQNRLFYDIKLIRLGSRPRVRRQILDLLIGVRILSPQPKTRNA